MHNLLYRHVRSLVVEELLVDDLFRLSWALPAERNESQIDTFKELNFYWHELTGCKSDSCRCFRWVRARVCRQV